MDRDSAFSYLCRGCGRCCYHKRIQTNPYEVLRLARNRGVSTAGILREYLEPDGPYLRVRDDGACVFLDDGGCTVHPDRPLACRTYPLGRWVDAEGVETFRALDPHPDTEGEYGTDGTVADYLDGQGEAPYSAAADRYQRIFYRLFDALQAALAASPESGGELAENAGRALAGSGAGGASALADWLDVAAAVADYCAGRGLEVPRDVEEILNLHCLALDQRVHQLTGEEP